MLRTGPPGGPPGPECLSKTSKTGLKPHKNKPNCRVQEWAGNTFCYLAGGLTVCTSAVDRKCSSLIAYWQLTHCRVNSSLNILSKFRAVAHMLMSRKTWKHSDTVSGKVLSCCGPIIETQINFIAIYKQIFRCAELPCIEKQIYTKVLLLLLLPLSLYYTKT